MRIGIDARLIFQTGVGRYIRNLIYNLEEIDKDNNYVIFLRKEDYHKFDLSNNRWSKRTLDVKWHSLLEQIIMPIVFKKERLDLVHIPYFTIPIFYPGKIIATIHDLTILHISTGKASTLPYPLYLLRRVGYIIILFLGVHKAKHLLTVSNATKEDIIKLLKVKSSNITVAYEGVDPIFTVDRNYKRILNDPYFLYVGNAYPHKNLDFLLECIAELANHYSVIEQNKLKFVFVGKKDFFYTRLLKKIEDLKLSKFIVFKHDVDDNQLASLYQHAKALLLPTKMEGFGLPALEALSMGCNVIASDIPVFRELLGDNATLLPLNKDIWCNEILARNINEKHVRKKIKFPHLSWQNMSMHTNDVYENCISL